MAEKNENQEYPMARVCEDDAAAAVLEKLRSGVNPRMSITGVANTDNPEISVIVGCDWLKVFVWGTQTEPERSTEYERLSKEAEKDSADRFFEVAGQTCEMKPRGFGKGSMKCEFAFHAGGIDIAVADWRPGSVRALSDSFAKRPIACIEFQGRYLYGRHWKDVLDEVDFWASQLGFADCEYRLSRLDIAIDVYGRSVTDVEINRILGGTMCRATDDNTRRSHGHITGVEFGQPGADTRLVCYDKQKELSKEPVKRQLFEAAYGPLSESVDITRYEFRLNRTALTKQHGCSTTEDLRERFASIVNYLTTLWYRETEPGKGRANERRVLEVWQAIHAGAVQAVGDRVTPRLKPLELTPEKDVLIAQAAGCITSAAAACNASCDSPIEFLSIVWDSLVASLEVGKLKAVEKLHMARARVADLQARAAPRFENIERMMNEIWESRSDPDNDVPLSIRAFGI